MLNIKIYFNEDGTSTRVDRDFDIYAGEFQNKLLSFYIPKSLVVSNYFYVTASDMIVVGSNNHIENYEDSGSESINLTALQFARKYVSRSGAISFSGTFYAHFNKEVSIGGKEYVLFSRVLPYEMTLNETSESIDNTMIVNVTNITRSPIYEDNELVGYKNTSYRIATTQEITLPILPSQYLHGEPVDDANEYAGLVNDLIADVDQLKDAVDGLDNTKQDKIDDNINTTDGVVNSNVVVTAINQLNTQVEQNLEDIASIEERMVQGFRFIGETTNSYNPATQSNLIEATFDALYVSAGLNPSEKENGDTITYIYVLPNQTDRNYRYIYSVNGWTYYELPPMEMASDNNAGLVKGGTSGTITTHIVAGLINNISVNGTSLSDIASATAQNTSDIASAFTKVGGELIANKSLADENGNNIANTYMTKVDGATKQFVRDYALPANYSNLYFITTGGYVDDAPTKVTPQFTNTITNIGTQTIFSLTRTFGEPYKLNKNNAIKNEIYVESNQTIDVEFTLTTVIKGQTATIIRSGTRTLNANEMQKIVLEGNLILLGSTELEISIGDTMQQVLQVTTQTLNASTTLDLYSNTTYPSTFNFSIASVSGTSSYFSKGILPYDSEFEYPAGATIFDLGTGAIYTSLLDENIGNALSNTTYWAKTKPTSYSAAEIEEMCDDILYPALPAPQNVSISGTVLSFDSVDGAESYEIYADGDTLGDFTPASSVGIIGASATEINPNDIVYLEADILPENSKDQRVIWSIEGDGVITYSNPTQCTVQAGSTIGNIVVTATAFNNSSASDSITIQVVPEPVELLDIDYSDGTIGSSYSNAHWLQEKYNNGWQTVTGQMNCSADPSDPSNKVVNMVTGYFMNYRYTYTPDNTLLGATSLSVDLGNYFSGAQPLSVKISVYDENNNQIYIAGDANNYVTIPVTVSLINYVYTFSSTNITKIQFLVKNSVNSNSYLYTDNIIVMGIGE